jgi:hypothetical protein
MGLHDLLTGIALSFTLAFDLAGATAAGAHALIRIALQVIRAYTPPHHVKV